MPELAYETVRIELQAAADKMGLPMPDLFVAERDIPSKPVGTESVVEQLQLELFA